MMTHQLKKGIVPSQLADAYSSGLPIVVVGRYSKERAFLEAVLDFLSAVVYLATLGVDISSALPSRDELVAQLRASTPITSSDGTGRVFKNWFLRIDLRATHGVVCLISCGTGKKLDEDDVQPFVNRLADEVRAVGAVALIGTRVDRLTRKAWSLGPVMLALDRVNGYLADRRRGVLRVNGIESIMTFFSAQAAEDEADKMPAQLARGMHTGTDSTMVNGRCKIAVGRAMPPGLFSYQSKVNGSRGPRIMTFDTPSCIPDHRDVATGRPEVYDADGFHVDQVANIRWLLATMGKPGWTYKTLAQELMTRSYSTDYVRRRHGMSARSVADFDEIAPKQFLRTILDNLDFYESGILRIKTGIAGYETITITNCYPPDGQPWAAPEDFSRLRNWVAEVRPINPRGLAFAQVPALVDGLECLMVTRSHEHLDGSRRYGLATCIAAPYRASFKVLSPPTSVMLPPGLLNEALAQAIIDAGECAYAMLETSGIEQIDELIQREIRLTELRLRDFQAERDNLRQQLSERTSDGHPALSGALLKEVNDRFNELTDEKIPQSRLAVDSAGETLRAAVAAQQSHRDGLALDAVLGLVATLRDPFNLSYRDFIRSSVRNLTINTLHRRVNGRSRQLLKITFDFIIREGDNVLVIPVAAEHVEKDVASDWESGDRILRELQTKPTTFAEVVPRNHRVATHALATRLDLNGRHIMLPSISDPRLAQLVALVIDDGDLERIAETTGESLALLQRLHEVHRPSTRAYWRKGKQTRVDALYRAADATGKITSTDGAPAPLKRWNDIHQVMSSYHVAKGWSYDRIEKEWTLSPCPHCGGTRRRQATIPEPVDLVCLDCRRDVAGHVWDAQYDRYLTSCD